MTGGPGAARWPDFFIVGAPRCGTTFLWETLRRVDGIFMPRDKEPMFFCADLDTGTPDDRRVFITSPDDYLGLFSAAQPGEVVGEACVFNLFSGDAARRIHAVRPDARIVISLREPVAQLISFHASRVADGVENLRLADALAAAPDRIAGRRLPERARIVPAYDYVSVASYARQVERYFALFGSDQVRIVVFEELIASTEPSVDSLIEFLGVTSAPPSLPGVINRQREIRSKLLATAMRSSRVIGRAKEIVPESLHPVAGRLAGAANRLNLRPGRALPIPAELRARLKDELRPDVQRLTQLVGIDLARRWYP